MVRQTPGAVTWFSRGLLFSGGGVHHLSEEGPRRYQIPVQIVVVVNPRPCKEVMEIKTGHLLRLVAGTRTDPELNRGAITPRSSLPPSEA